MGYAISWIAIKGLDKAEIYERLDMRPTGEISEIHEFNCSRPLKGGWILVVLDRANHPLVQETALEELSQQAHLIVCNIAENVMYCSAEAWENGACLWSVARYLDSDDVFDLQVSGNPPPILASIDRKYRKKQKAQGDHPQIDHMFEIPLALAASITGFKHDESDIEGFEMLTWEAEPMVKSWKPKQLKPWWQFWK